jgi:serine/threonine protein kinase
MGKIHRNALKQGYQLHWYTIKEILGQGGFGITYLAHDNNLDEDVAIKEYLPIELAVRERDDSVQPITEDRNKNYEWGLDRFIKEARTLSKFKHPNIVRVRSVSEENNTAYMVMEYEQGETLQDILTRRKTLEEAELLSVLVPILGGLALVHQAGFIHRDIKPANIFIRKDGSPVLIDFGSARQALGEQTKTLTSLVSPGYAPFEQYYSKGESQGPWTDIYGLGATLYRAVVGRTPLDAVDRSRSIHEGSKDTFVSAVDIGKDKYSVRFLKAIDHALKFKPTERPQSLVRWKTEFGIKNDLAEIKRLEIMEDQLTQPGTKVVHKRLSRIRPFTATLFIVLTICVLAFYYRDTIKALIKPILTETLESELVEVTPSPEEITLAEQKARAEAARLKQEQEITELLALAEEDFNAGRLVEPPGINALEHYLKVLELEADNTTAQSGKDKIFQHFLQSADALINEQNFDEAERALLKADITEPDSREVKLARLRLDEAKTEVKRIAMEDDRKRQEAERKRHEEEQKRLAEEKKRKEEEEAKRQEEKEKRLAELKKKEEEKKRKLEEEKRIEEAAKLAEIERQRKEDEVRRKAEEEKKEQYALLITEAEQAVSDKDKELAINKYNEALTLIPGDVVATRGLRNAEGLKHKVCYDVLGKWIWDRAFGTEYIILHEDGSIDYQIAIKGSGSWECTSPETRTIKIRLTAAGFSNEWLSTYSADGSCLLGPETWGDRGCYHRPKSEKIDPPQKSTTPNLGL